MPPELAYLLDYWREMHPASLSEISAWQGLRGVKLAWWEVTAIRRLEQLWNESQK
jgi:hypothetical protein